MDFVALYVYGKENYTIDLSPVAGGWYRSMDSYRAPEDASRGYYLGAMLLESLAPKSECETFSVAVSTDISIR